MARGRQHGAVARPREGVARPDADGVAVLDERLVEPALRRQRGGEGNVGLRERPQRDGAPVLGHGGVEVSRLLRQVAEALVAVRVVRCERDHACPHRARVSPGLTLPPGECAEHHQDRQHGEDTPPRVLGGGHDRAAREHGPAHGRQVGVAIRRHLRPALRQAERGRERDQIRGERGPERGSVRRFVEASTGGDLRGLVGLLAEDVVLYADGGGKAAAVPKPVRGASRVARFAVKAIRKFVAPEAERRIVPVNGAPGVVTYLDRRAVAVLAVDVHDGRISAVYIVTNPDKLARVPGLPAGPS
jgi:hypothetical protein